MAEVANPFFPDYKALYEGERKRADRLQEEVRGSLHIIGEAIRQLGGTLEVPKNVMLDDRPEVRRSDTEYVEAPSGPPDAIIYREDPPSGDVIRFVLKEKASSS